MSDHTWCLGMRVCEDKIRCHPRQLNGGCIEIAPDSHLVGLHLFLPRTATAECEARDTRRGSRAVGPSTHCSCSRPMNAAGKHG